MYMRRRRIKVGGCTAVYHCMTRTVNGERLLGDREKEMLRKQLWQVADFSGVEVLTFCIMSNHFHVLVRVPEPAPVSDAELLRRYSVLYPKPTKYQTASVKALAETLAEGGTEKEQLRQRLLARMTDVSEFMKTLKQRFSVWFNKSHGRYGTLWSERFKSVLVEGQDNPLQTMAAYIDLNPVRAGMVQDPKDYRFSGYGEAIVGNVLARQGLRGVWHGGFGVTDDARALQSHRKLMYAKGSNDRSIPQEDVLRVLEQENAILPKSQLLRCRVRYFTDGAIFGSKDFVESFVGAVQLARGRKFPPRAHTMKGADWGGLAVIQGLRSKVFG
ncbi:MAG: putative transposase [Lentimonas sp.]|jgi:putative transposase